MSIGINNVNITFLLISDGIYKFNKYDIYLVSTISNNFAYYISLESQEQKERGI